MENLPTLPNDIIRQILCRCASVKTLLRLTRSCKFFRNLINSDPHFARSHSHLTRAARQVDQLNLLTYSPVVLCEPPKHRCKLHLETSALVNTSITNRDLKDLYIGKSIHIAGSSNGIICLYQYYCKKELTKIYFWNPTMHQVRALPGYLENYAKSNFIGFGYDSKNQQHKFVHIHSSSPKVDVYCLENDSWRSFTHDLPCRSCRTPQHHPTIAKSVELNGSLHWISTKDSVIKFGLSDERISEFVLPEFEEKGLLSLGAVKGRLSLLNDHYRTSKIWSMNGKSGNSNGEGSWINITEFRRLSYNLVEFTTNGKVISGWRGDIVSYDPITEGYEILGPYVEWDYLSKEPGHRYQIISYLPSLISVYPPTP